MRWIWPFDYLWDILFSDMTKQEIHVYVRTYKDDMFSEYKGHYDEMNNIFARLEELENGKININDIRFSRQQNDRQVNNISNQIDALNKKVNNLQEQLKKVTASEYRKQSAGDTETINQLLSRIGNLEKKISILEKKSDKDNSTIGTSPQIGIHDDNQINEYKAWIEKLERTIEVQGNIIKAQQSKLSTLEKTITNLSAVIEKFIGIEQIIPVKERQSAEDNKIVATEKEKSKKEFNVDDLPVFNPHETTPQMDTDASLILNLEKQYDIKKFDIENTNKLFLSGNISKIKIELQKALNTDNIIKFLQQSSLENKQTYLKFFEKYKRDVQKFIDKVVVDEDDEEIWENITEKFFEIVQKDILSNFMISIYRGLKSESDRRMYEQFLSELNKYLAFCCIYTQYIHPDVKYTKDDINDMESSQKETNDLGKDGYIDEVEQLPYYIDYLNEDGEKEHFCYDGRFVIWKYKEKKQVN